MHNRPVLGLAQICRAALTYHTTSSTVCCMAWCVVIMHIPFAAWRLQSKMLGQLHSSLKCYIATIKMMLAHQEAANNWGKVKGNSLGWTAWSALAVEVSFAMHMCSCSGGIFTLCSSRWWTDVCVKLMALQQSLPFNHVTGWASSCSGSCTIPGMSDLLQLAHPAMQPCYFIPTCPQLLGKHVSTAWTCEACTSLSYFLCLQIMGKCRCQVQFYNPCLTELLRQWRVWATFEGPIFRTQVNLQKRRVLLCRSPNLANYGDLAGIV